MKLLIVGLGLMGGSYAKRLSQLGYEVYGVDLDDNAIAYGLNQGWIVAGGKEAKSYIPLVDWIIICLYPTMVLPFLREHVCYFQSHHRITDISGVKGFICEEATKLSFPAKFIGAHPMAGREKIGIQFAEERIFFNANFLICPVAETDPLVIEELTELAKSLGFGKVTEIEPTAHDHMIAYTSQLAHAMAVGLVNSKTSDQAGAFIGDSYRDLTRIAMINEILWSELFLLNQEQLCVELDLFLEQMLEIRKALVEHDTKRLQELFQSATRKRRAMI